MRRFHGWLVTALGSVVLIALLAHMASIEVAADWPPEDNLFAASLALDSNGVPHISFWDKNLGSNLRYGSWDESEGEWSDEVVDSVGSVGHYTSLAMDANDYPHISYYDISFGDLRYAYWDGAQWILEVVDAIGDVGSEGTSLVLDGAGLPHISYFDDTNGDLKFAYWDLALGAWAVQIVDDEGTTGLYSSLQLDSAGEAHVSYHKKSTANLKYAHGVWDGSVWVWATEKVDTAGSVGEYTSLALDAADQPHISYYDSGNEDLRYASWDSGSGSWTITVVDGAGDVGRFTSIALDSSGYPHISYHDYSIERVRYARWDGSDWLIEIVDDTVKPLGDTSLKLDASDQPHLAYAEKTSVSLRSAFWDADQQQWVIQTVYDESAAGVGYYISLELDSGGGAHASYYDKGPRDLKYARRYWDGSAWIWDVDIVDAEDRTGRYCSMELDANDYPHIGYLDSSNLEESWAYWDGSQWVQQAVPNPYGMGRFQAMALDANDLPHFASWGQYANGLCYAYWDGSLWHSEVLDTDGNPGRSTSILMDAGGRPHISYNSNEDLRYAHWDGTQWILQSVASIGPASDADRMGTSIALDASDQPCISYQDSTELDLIYASWDGTAWFTETVDAENNVGARSSLRFGGDGHPRIAYYDRTYGDVKYARWDGSAWQIELVDTQGDAGWYLSMALESAPPYNPHISYIERDDGVVKYAYWNGLEWVIEVADDPKVQPAKILAVESDEQVAAGATMHFTATVTGFEPITYNWDFGGAGTPGGSDTNPSFLYDDYGTYNVTLTVENRFPPSDTESILVDVVHPAEILAVDSDEPVAIGTTMQFTATVIGTEPITYTWDFGGSGTPGGSDTNPSFLYDDYGTYDVTLTVENHFPPSDTQSILVDVLAHEIYLPVMMRD